ncbi:hypothetical protein ACFFV7_49105 [Nonomuraea spiralis]|uniref:Uncharacterized protein n=1 Tax=Nonomuraea spiralis TaxID=46182 RepID=A0ABV5IXL9_9ACTN|nr:hypothetical protein [Nonomuraea spiralis]
MTKQDEPGRDRQKAGTQQRPYREAGHQRAHRPYAVCLYVPGPAWLWVSTTAHSAGFAPLPQAGEVYRRALAAGVPQAEDERLYGRALAADIDLTALEPHTPRLP